MKVYKSTEELSKELTEVKETLEGFKKLVEIQKKEIYELKRFVSEDIKNKNLLHGYRKVIEDISSQVRK